MLKYLIYIINLALFLRYINLAIISCKYLMLTVFLKLNIAYNINLKKVKLKDKFYLILRYLGIKKMILKS